MESPDSVVALCFESDACPLQRVLLHRCCCNFCTAAHFAPPQQNAQASRVVEAEAVRVDEAMRVVEAVRVKKAEPRKTTSASVRRSRPQQPAVMSNLATDQVLTLLSEAEDAFFVCEDLGLQAKRALACTCSTLRPVIFQLLRQPKASWSCRSLMPYGTTPASWRMCSCRVCPIKPCASQGKPARPK